MWNNEVLSIKTDILMIIHYDQYYKSLKLRKFKKKYNVRF